MILIADSGTTKTDWRAIENSNTVLPISTEGINPVFQAPEKLNDILANTLGSQINLSEVSKVYFYSAGISASHEATSALMSAFELNFKNCEFFVETDNLVLCNLCFKLELIGETLPRLQNDYSFFDKQIESHDSISGLHINPLSIAMVQIARVVRQE